MGLSRATTGATSQHIEGEEDPLAPKTPNIKPKAVIYGAISALFSTFLVIVKYFILVRE